jgi:hypothetical protein
LSSLTRQISQRPVHHWPAILEPQRRPVEAMWSTAACNLRQIKNRMAAAR